MAGGQVIGAGGRVDRFEFRLLGQAAGDLMRAAGMKAAARRGIGRRGDVSGQDLLFSLATDSASPRM